MEFVVDSSTINFVESLNLFRYSFYKLLFPIKVSAKNRISKVIYILSELDNPQTRL